MPKARQPRPDRGPDLPPAQRAAMIAELMSRLRQLRRVFIKRSGTRDSTGAPAACPRSTCRSCGRTNTTSHPGTDAIIPWDIKRL